MSKRTNVATKNTFILLDIGEYDVELDDVCDFNHGQWPSFEWKFKVATDAGDRDMTKLTGLNISSKSNLGAMLLGMTLYTIEELTDPDFDVDSCFDDLIGKKFKAFITQKPKDYNGKMTNFNVIETVYLAKTKNGVAKKK